MGRNNLVPLIASHPQAVPDAVPIPPRYLSYLHGLVCVANMLQERRRSGRGCDPTNTKRLSRSVMVKWAVFAVSAVCTAGVWIVPSSLIRCTTTLPAARDADSSQQPVRSGTLASCRLRSLLSSVRIHLQLRLAFTEVPSDRILSFTASGLLATRSASASVRMPWRNNSTACMSNVCILFSPVAM